MNAVPDSVPDLTPCDREPITRLDRIQPFGFLLAVTIEWKVIRASANLQQLLGIEPRMAVGTQLQSLFTASALHDIRNRMPFLKLTAGVERLHKVVLVAGRPAFDVAIHYADELLLVEGEPSGGNERTDAASLVRAMMTRLRSWGSLDAFHTDAVRQIRALTGFDRVLIYRFSEDGAGEVIAEAHAPGIDSLLGLHYPASDVPAQARALYLRNPFRIIADVDAPNVALLPETDNPESALDLALSMTRAVSPVHIEYLKNMGVVASMSISIIFDGALWGFIACHNGSPRLPSFVLRSAAELFGHLYSLSLESWLRRSHDEVDRKTLDFIDRMVTTNAGHRELLMNAGWLHEALKEVIDCDGVATLTRGGLSVSGSVPTDSDIEAIADRLNAMPEGRRIFATNHLTAFRPEAAAHAELAAGVMVLPIARVPRDLILLFRREISYEINWAGNPEKPASLSEHGRRLSPRKDFELFSTHVRGRSRPFTVQEQRAAETLRSALVEALLQSASGFEGERHKSTERHEILIAELNHRVRNILALIRGLVSQSKGNAGDLAVARYVESLDGRILAIARAHDQITRQNWGPGSLATLFEGEMSIYAAERLGRFTLLGSDVRLHPAAFSALSLVVHELVTNSNKYGSLSANGRVTVTLDRQPGAGLNLRWRETEGPEVQPPRRRGFGSVVIERIVPFELQGTVDLRYARTGVEADFQIPEAHISQDNGELSVAAAAKGPFADPAGTSSPKAPLSGLTVLLLEDNMIVALEAEDMLRKLGAAAIFTTSTIADAARIFDEEHVDFALLDINLGGQNSLKFANKVDAAGVAFVFSSGFGSDSDLGHLHLSAVTISKPYTLETLGSVVAGALRARNFPP